MQQMPLMHAAQEASVVQHISLCACTSSGSNTTPDLLSQYACIGLLLPKSKVCGCVRPSATHPCIQVIACHARFWGCVAVVG